MNLLSEILSSQVRAEILRLLFDGQKISLHMREIQRKSHLAIGTIQKEISHLKSLDLVAARKDGNRLYFTANTSHPLYRLICELVKKTSGIPEKIKAILTPLDGLECAFIFGSYAKGAEKAHSDIDLLVIGDIGLRTLTAKFKSLTDQIEREINPHVMSKASWSQRLKKNDHFIRTILSEKKIFLVGDEDVLR